MDSLVAGEGGGPTVDARRRREVTINNNNGGAGIKMISNRSKIRS